METLSNFIKGLQIIEKYMIEDLRFPFVIDGYTISFNVDPKKIKNITEEDKKTLLELKFHIGNDDIYTNEYTW